MPLRNKKKKKIKSSKNKSSLKKLASITTNTLSNVYSRYKTKLEKDKIKEIKLKSLRDLIGLVTQDSILFNDTIKGNIALGKPDASDEEVIEALKIANAFEFVKELPEGIHTNIGDSGNKLSGGQKQRVLIAMALSCDPALLIADEPTTALDVTVQKEIIVLLKELQKENNMSILFISHDLPLVSEIALLVP
mgnify:CR=1 FL=1